LTSNTKDIKEGLASKEIIGLVIPDVGYEEMLIKVAGILSKDYNKILYISINKPYKNLISKFKQNKINTNKFYFIDCITRTAKEQSQTKNSYFISSPRALDEIQTAILDVFREQRIDAVLIDSPSALLTYYEHMDVLKFIHFLAVRLVIAGSKGVFPFQKESKGPLRRSIEMFIDKIIYLEPDK